MFEIRGEQNRSQAPEDDRRHAYRADNVLCHGQLGGTRPAGARGTLSFDAMGYLAGYTSPVGRMWQLSSNADGRLLEFTAPSGHVLSMAYTPEGLPAAYPSTTQNRIALFYDLRRYTASQYADGTTERVVYSSEGDPRSSAVALTPAYSAPTTSADGNPLNRTDHTGLWSWKSVAALAAGAVVGIAVGIVLAPIAIPLAIIAGGIAAGAGAGGLNEALNEQNFNLSALPVPWDWVLLPGPPVLCRSWLCRLERDCWPLWEWMR